MVAPTHSFPRCTAEIFIEREVQVRISNGGERDGETDRLQGTCDEVFRKIRENYPPELKMVEGKVSIQFVPEKREIYSLIPGKTVVLSKQTIGRLFASVIGSMVVVGICIVLGGEIPADKMEEVAENFTRKVIEEDKELSYIPQKSFASAFEKIRNYMGIEGSENDKIYRIALPLSWRSLTLCNLSIRRQDDEKI